MIVALPSLGACGGAGAPPGGSGAAAGPPRPALSYADPGVERTEYRFADTAEVTMDLGGAGLQRVPVESAARLALSLTPTGQDVRVRMRFVEFSGRIGGAMGGSTEASQDEITGPLVFSLTPRGEVVLQSLPDLGPRAEQLLNPASLARELFPRFPARPPSAPGATWSDTLTYRAGRDDDALRAERHLTYTLGEEISLAGRRVLRIAGRGRARYTFEGTRMGMEARQTLEGPVESEILWDPVRRIPVSVRTEKRLTGTMELPALGTPPVPLELRGTTRVRLVGS
ncbi:MAG TPA: hypothetical protein VLL48_11490 [Longimicrobiales bacterium]|nr:hypothetical protein [Longimicrobiales bacterium]